MAWLTGWIYRKSVPISRASGAVTNYQMKLLLGESAGAIGETVDCEGLCLSNFNDIRFTTSDGATLLDYWIESLSGVTPNQLATIWIEFNSIGIGDTTFYMYFGNAAAPAVSSGANTFIVFDDFERGADGDTIGGNWTETVAHVHISTEQIYKGSKAAKLVGGVGNSAATINVVEGSTIAIRMMTYKEDAAVLMTFVHGNGTKGITVQIAADEKIQYYDGAWKDTGSSGTADAWRSIEVCNFDYSALTYDIYYNGSIVKSAAAMRNLATNDGSCKVQGDSTADRDGWIDNFLVRQWYATEPAWGAWGSIELFVSMTVVASPFELTTTLTGSVAVGLPPLGVTTGIYLKVLISSNWGDPTSVCLSQIHICNAAGVKRNVETMWHNGAKEFNDYGVPVDVNAKNCSDSDGNTYWQFGIANLPYSWFVYLGNRFTFSTIKIAGLASNPDAMVKDFQVFASQDSATWVSLGVFSATNTTDEQTFVLGPGDTTRGPYIGFQTIASGPTPHHGTAECRTCQLVSAGDSFTSWIPDGTVFTWVLDGPGKLVPTEGFNGRWSEDLVNASPYSGDSGFPCSNPFPSATVVYCAPAALDINDLSAIITLYMDGGLVGSAGIDVLRIGGSGTGTDVYKPPHIYGTPFPEPWSIENKEAGPWEFTKQPDKLGYINNPRWKNLDTGKTQDDLMIWNPNQRKMSAGNKTKHDPCGYWYSSPGGGGGGYFVRPSSIGYTSLEMGVGTTQQLTALDENGDVLILSPYCHWEISGCEGGSVSSGGLVTAPATNVNCGCVITISLVCNDVVITSIQIAVSAGGPPSNAIWYLPVQPCLRQAQHTAFPVFALSGNEG